MFLKKMCILSVICAAFTGMQCLAMGTLNKSGSDAEQPAHSSDAGSGSELSTLSAGTTSSSRTLKVPCTGNVFQGCDPKYMRQQVARVEAMIKTNPSQVTGFDLFIQAFQKEMLEEIADMGF